MTAIRVFAIVLVFFCCSNTGFVNFYEGNLCHICGITKN
jgi:hypothetical protein